VEGEAMASSIAYASDISMTLQNVTNELRQLQDLLLFAEKLDPSILTDFRDIINRIRHNAWAVQQYGELIANEIEPTPSARFKLENASAQSASFANSLKPTWTVSNAICKTLNCSDCTTLHGNWDIGCAG
jgi:hypothetical protein